MSSAHRILVISAIMILHIILLYGETVFAQSRPAYFKDSVLLIDQDWPPNYINHKIFGKLPVGHLSPNWLVDPVPDNAFTAAVKKGDSKALDRALDQLSPDNDRKYTEWATFMTATLWNKIAIVQHLLNKGIDVDIAYSDKELNYDNWTPLMTAALKGNQLIVQRLVQKGANVNHRAGDGKTPLYLAALNNHYATAKYLISQGAKVNAFTDFAQTPLHIAARHGHAAVVELLIRAGADVNARRQGKETPLHFAALCNEAHNVKILILYGADPHATLADGRKPIDMLGGCRPSHSAIQVTREILTHYMNQGVDPKVKRYAQKVIGQMDYRKSLIRKIGSGRRDSQTSVSSGNSKDRKKDSNSRPRRTYTREVIRLK